MNDTRRQSDLAPAVGSGCQEARNGTGVLVVGAMSASAPETARGCGEEKKDTRYIKWTLSRTLKTKEIPVVLEGVLLGGNPRVIRPRLIG